MSEIHTPCVGVCAWPKSVGRQVCPRGPRCVVRSGAVRLLEAAVLSSGPSRESLPPARALDSPGVGCRYACDAWWVRLASPFRGRQPGRLT